MGKTKNAYRILVGKLPVESLRRRLEDNIQMDVCQINCEGRRCMELAQEYTRCRHIRTLLALVEAAYLNL
jgi:hypothetical protein